MRSVTTIMKKAILSLIAVATLCAASVSCIKDTVTYNYMQGKITFTIDDYIYAGDVVQLTAGGITTPAYAGGTRYR